MAPDGQTIAPNVYDSEPIPEAARAEIDRLIATGDLFRYTAPADAPVALLERAVLEGNGPLLAVDQVTRTYKLPREKLWQTAPLVHALQGVSFTMQGILE